MQKISNNGLRALTLSLLAGCTGDHAVTELVGLEQGSSPVAGPLAGTVSVTPVHQPFVQQQVADDYAEQAARQWEQDAQVGLHIATGSGQAEAIQLP